MPDRPDLVLHIGSVKTGTTTVQALLHGNRRRLVRRAGLFVPASPGRRRHVRFGLAMSSDAVMTAKPAYHRQGVASPDELRERYHRELTGELRTVDTSRLLLSDEVLFDAPADTVGRVREHVSEIADRVRLVAYLRRQDDHLISDYQQRVKTGETRRLAQRLTEPALLDAYDYDVRLRRWHDLLAPDEMVVRAFQRDRFVDGSLLADFLDAAAIDVPLEALRPVTPRNESLDAESVEFLRLLNLHLVEDRGVLPGRISHQALSRTLAEHGDGPVLTLPQSDLDQFMAGCDGGNRRVARSFVGLDDGQLFTAPRRTRHATTVQRLDPDRLSRFLDLAELPVESHEPMLRIAEREAGTRARSTG